jgi:SAM-dependent methyltransferase
MVDNFGDYAAYYDALYARKDYEAEVAFVLSCFDRWLDVPPRNILDLGCGSGWHGIHFARKGLSVCGVERSQDMLAHAKNNVDAAGLANAVQLAQGDIRNFRGHQEFDAVVSLFHVISYQVQDQDVQDALATAYAHLKPGGVFVFDYWHSQALYRQPPERRELRFEIDGQSYIRRVLPEWDPDKNFVRLRIDIEQKQDHSDQFQVVSCETHDMRHFDADYFAQDNLFPGFECLETREYMTGKPVSPDSFGIYSILRKVA